MHPVLDFSRLPADNGEKDFGCVQSHPWVGRQQVNQALDQVLREANPAGVLNIHPQRHMKARKNIQSPVKRKLDITKNLVTEGLSSKLILYSAMLTLISKLKLVTQFAKKGR